MSLPQNSTEALAAIRRLNAKQQDALGQCAMNNDRGSFRTFDSLEKRGLVESYQEPLSDKVGRYTIKRYRVPIFVHMAWCQWASEQESDGAGETEGSGE